MKKNKSQQKPIQEWKKVITTDVKYNSYSLDEFLEWIKDVVPENTSNEDIKFNFDVSQEPTYYDDYIINVEMNVYVRTEEWKRKNNEK